MELYVTKLPNGCLAPEGQETLEALSLLKVGDILSFEMKKKRNPQFLRKFMVMMDYAFDQWEPPEGPAKERVRFRKDITILAGYYDIVPRVKGPPKAEAKSLSFASMKEEEFALVYEAVLKTLMKYVLTNHTRDDVDRVLTHLAEFG